MRALPFALALAIAVSLAPAAAQKKTICTVTVNSADEKEAMRARLPKGDYEFVELVEKGRPDWLASACRQGVRCDALIISGHHDNEQGFFSDRVEAGEYLNEGEMERVACSDSCPGLFSQLKEVYLFGCNTLNPQALRSDATEIARSLMQSGHAPAEAERLARSLAARYADSSRDRMRHIFRNVPAIYGFSSVAPLGPTAAANLDRYFQNGGSRDVATGRAGTNLLGYFPGRSECLVDLMQDLVVVVQESRLDQRAVNEDRRACTVGQADASAASGADRASGAAVCERLGRFRKRRSTAA